MKVELIEKTDLLNIVINDPDLNIDNFKKMKVNELRELLKITHKINGQYKNMSGHCFKCLTPLRPDYIQFENYCKDC
jgi:hypothetical protein